MGIAVTNNEDTHVKVTVAGVAAQGEQAAVETESFDVAPGATLNLTLEHFARGVTVEPTEAPAE